MFARQGFYHLSYSPSLHMRHYLIYLKILTDHMLYARNRLAVLNIRMEEKKKGASDSHL
jgi:hypothetical protein